MLGVLILLCPGRPCCPAGRMQVVLGPRVRLETLRGPLLDMRDREGPHTQLPLPPARAQTPWLHKRSQLPVEHRALEQERES